ncbi:uncharacterized protein PHALS_12626 [Plasmopara halstedii]|uniref:Uncharacterized protein n=1 Tax=Plasmopara halstedii TaxID=4781 RepID=A0A0N7L5T2_PLAHL|nr:uncharacterized protein PHALS_12626 [Plasmopara halstedii]CEG42347.1 hypothetical protein PHALS_12626 [Plasmopara halstedii]|eukprot:XP_024578716.1 hypothetical protein PHALS_12626 [Plasmopara halstedii]
MKQSNFESSEYQTRGRVRQELGESAEGNWSMDLVDTLSWKNYFNWKIQCL